MMDEFPVTMEFEPSKRIDKTCTRCMFCTQYHTFGVSKRITCLARHASVPNPETNSCRAWVDRGSTLPLEE